MSLYALKSSFLKLSGDSGPSQILLEEKQVIRGLQSLGKDTRRVSECLRDWGHQQHEDLKDVTDKYHDIMIELSRSFEMASLSHHSARQRLKEVRNRYQEVVTLRKQVKQLQEKLSSAIQQRKPYEQLQLNLYSAESTLREREATYAACQRALLRESMSMELDAWACLAQDILVVSKYGKFLSEQIPQGTLAPGQPLPPFTRKNTTALIVSDFINELKEVRNQRKGDDMFAYPIASSSQLQIPTQGIRTTRSMSDLHEQYQAERNTMANSSGHSRVSSFSNFQDVSSRRGSHPTSNLVVVDGHEPNSNNWDKGMNDTLRNRPKESDLQKRPIQYDMNSNTYPLSKNESFHQQRTAEIQALNSKSSLNLTDSGNSTPNRLLELYNNSTVQDQEHDLPSIPANADSTLSPTPFPPKSPQEPSYYSPDTNRDEIYGTLSSRDTTTSYMPVPGVNPPLPPRKTEVQPYANNTHTKEFSSQQNASYDNIETKTHEEKDHQAMKTSSNSTSIKLPLGILPSLDGTNKGDITLTEGQEDTTSIPAESSTRSLERHEQNRPKLSMTDDEVMRRLNRLRST